MDLHFTLILRGLAALVGGGLIGLSFGRLQQAATRRHQELAQSGQLKAIWTLIPGAGARVAYLLIALALVQLICPLLFVDGTQWFVSAGLLVGYGLTLYSQLRLRLRAGPA